MEKKKKMKGNNRLRELPVRGYPPVRENNLRGRRTGEHIKTQQTRV